MQVLAGATVIALGERKRRTGDGAAHATGAEDLAHKRRLARAEIARHGDERRRRE